jgi:hypothetical protein
MPTLYRQGKTLEDRFHNLMIDGFVVIIIGITLFGDMLDKLRRNKNMKRTFSFCMTIVLWPFVQAWAGSLSPESRKVWRGLGY